jgi:hypothetical protein
MSLLNRRTSNLLRVLDPTLFRSLGKVHNVILLCCGLVVTFKVLPSCWRWAIHFVHRGRLRDQTLDSGNLARGEFDGIDGSLAKFPPDGLTEQREVNALDTPCGLQILHCNPEAIVE